MRDLPAIGKEWVPPPGWLKFHSASTTNLAWAKNLTVQRRWGSGKVVLRPNQDGYAPLALGICQSDAERSLPSTSSTPRGGTNVFPPVIRLYRFWWLLVAVKVRNWREVPLITRPAFAGREKQAVLVNELFWCIFFADPIIGMSNTIGTPFLQF